MKHALIFSLWLFGLCFSLQGANKDTIHVFRGATLYPATSKPIPNGVLAIRNGKIVAIGPVGKVDIPKVAKVHNVKGTVIIPGLVDTHSHVGLWGRPDVPSNSDGNEGSGPVQSSLRALDAINPLDPGIRMAIAGGVTTANIMPGSANVIGGQTLYVKFRGRTVEEMRIKGPVLGGLKMANGENPKRWNFERRKMPPSTRMKLTALQREQFIKAREYQNKWKKYREKKTDQAPERELAMESLVEVLERKRTVHFHSHRADDLMTAVRLSKEFGFELVLQHATEGYLVKEELVKAKIPCSLTLVDSPGGKLEIVALLEENAAILHEAGVKVAINTDDAITESRFFLRTGACAVRGGMSEDAALKALTIHGAEMMHLEKRVGSLEEGKDADFVILSGKPFSVRTQVLETWIDGEQVFSRENKEDGAYQTGGFGVGHQSEIPPPSALLKPLATVNAPKLPKGVTEAKDKPKTLVILAGRLHTVSKGDMKDAAIIVNNGRIQWVGKRSELKAPNDAEYLTASVVTPGLIDAHSVVGLAGTLNINADQDQNEGSGPNQAELRVLDAFNPREQLVEHLRRQGVTIVQATPGPANVIAGQCGIFRTSGNTIERARIRFPSGLLINLGEVPKSTYENKLPTTRMGTASLVRKAFVDAQNYARKKGVPANLQLDALKLALEKKIPVYFSAHRGDDIQTALRLTEEFKLNSQLFAATEGYLFHESLKKAKVPIVVHPTLQRVGGIETFNTHLGNAGVLAKAKIPIAIGSGFEAYVPKARVVRVEAAMAMVNGLGFEAALRSITLDAAKLIGIDNDYGSVEKGKVADLVLYNGDPFEHTTHVMQTISGGRIVYNRKEYLKLPYERRALPLQGNGVGCCLGVW